MSRRPLRWALAAVLLCCALAAWWAVRHGPGRRPADAPSVLLSRSEVTLAPGVHLLGKTFPNASYAVETDDGIALVDTCAESDAAPIVAQLETLGLDPRRVRWILLTHAHADHSQGVNRLREISGARVHAGAGDCGVLRAGGPREALCSVFRMPEAPHATPVDVEVSDGDTLDLGGSRFRLVAAPGHSPGSVCYLLERGGRRILFAGDVIMSLTDADPLAGPGTYTAYLAPCYRGSARDHAATLRRLLAMPAPDLVCPGHPAADAVPQDPYVTKERWERLLTTAIGRMDALAGRLERDGADFLDGTPKELLPGLSYLGNAGDRALCVLTSREGRTFLFGAPAPAGGPDLPALLDARRRAARGGAADPPPLTAVLLTSSRDDETAGLARLVEATRCVVFAPDAALAAVAARCPRGTDIRAAESLRSSGWLAADVIPLEGLDTPAVGYVLEVHDRTVLVTGREPTRLLLDDGIPLLRSFPWEGADAAAWRRSLDALGRVTPDVWIPAIPVDGQNANVYGDDWARVLAAARAEAR